MTTAIGVRGKPKWTRDLVVSELRRLAVDGLAPYAMEHRALHRAARELFGSWARACEVAGVKPRSRRGGNHEYTYLVTTHDPKRARIARERLARMTPGQRFKLRVFILAMLRGITWTHENPFRFEVA